MAERPWADSLTEEARKQAASRQSWSEELVEQPLVSVVLPTYNEAETITTVIEDVLAELGSGFGEGQLEVVVVDDDSPDGTWRIARDRFADDERVCVVVRRNAQGLSSAILDGIHESSAPIVVCMDADGQHPAARLPDLVEAIYDGADLVVGSRHAEGGSIEGWSTRRTLTSKGATLLARVAVPAARGVSDPMSGFFAIDRWVFTPEVLERADPHGYKLLLELAALVPDADIEEVPITFLAREAGDSKLTLDAMLRFVEHLAGLWFLSVGLDERVNPPLLVRSLEAGALTAISLPLLYLGIILGGVEGAAGAALIATAGGAITLAFGRLARSGERWEESREVYAK